MYSPYQESGWGNPLNFLSGDLPQVPPARGFARGSRADVTINVKETQLTIRGERPEEKQQKENLLLRPKRAHGRFYRSMTLPTEVNPDKAKASFKGGVLVIDLPKVTKNKAKAISIS